MALWGGAETSPIWLRKHIGFKGFLSETFRDICNLFTFIDPIFLRSLEKCSKIIFTTRSGEKYLKKKFYKKAIFCPAVGLNQNEYPSIKVSPKKQKRILFVGRHLHWKGMKIGIEAFKEALHKDPKLSLTIVGSGNASKYWKNLTERYKIEKKVEWQPWVSKEKLKEIYKDHGIFLFPSLHDSGGFVVLEAMKYGLPVICLDLGGPADFVDNSSGIVIKTKIKNYKLLLNNLSSAIYYLSNDLISWKSYSIGAQNRAKDFSINNVVQRIYK